MSEIGKAYLTIIPSFKSGMGRELQHQLESGSQPEQTGKSIGSKVGSGVQSGLSTLKVAMGSFLGNIATGAFDMIVGGITDIAHEAVSASDATDKFKSTLDFAGVDTSGIERLTASCQKYADETVYDLSDIQNITAQLAANNVKDFDRLAEAAGNLNAVAGGNKDTFKSVGMVLTQTAGQGKLTTENFNQLADAIPGASGKIQQELANMGAYTGNFRDAMAAGEITAEEFNQAILNLGFQDAAVEAATSASTMEGAMGNLEASVQKLLMNGFDLIKPALTSAISGFADFISEVPAMFQVGFGAISEALAPFAEQCQAVLGPAIQLLIDKFLEFCSAVAPLVMPVFQALGEVFSFIAPIIGDVFVVALDLVIQTLTAIFDQLTVFLDWMSSTFGPFWESVLLPVIQVAWEGIKGAVTIAVDTIKGAIDIFVGVVSATWTTFWGVVGTVVETVWNTIQTVIQTVMGVIQGVIDTVMGVITGNWDQAWNGIKQIGQSIWDGIKNLIQIAIDAIKGIIENVLNGIKSLWDSIWNAIKGVAETVWNAIKSVIDGAINAVKSTIDNVLNGIKSLWDNTWNAIKSLAETVWNGIKSVIEGAINAVKGVIDNILNTIKSIWDNGWNTIKNAVTTAWDGIKNGVSQGIDTVVNFVSGLPGKILGALGDLGGLLWNAGKSIIDGFLNGLKSAWGAVTDFVGGIAGWISSHKGPLDYDRKLLVANGEAIMQGLSTGLHGGFKGIMGDVSSMGSDLQKQVERSLCPIDGSKLVGNLDLSIAAQPMTADDLRDVFADMGGSGEIALYIDSKKVASTIASPMDAVLATRQSRLGRQTL